MNDFLKAIFAGAAIGIGTQLYLSIGGIAGAIGFAIGLYLVLWFNLNLYTGKIGYAKFSDAPKLLLIFLGNAIGCFLMLMMLHNPIAQGIVIAKLQDNLIMVFFKAIICGMLIYAAVDQFKKGREYAPLIAVPAFILCGAEHCIADICFFISAGVLTWNFVPFLLVVIVGNSMGSLLLHRLI